MKWCQAGRSAAPVPKSLFGHTSMGVANSYPILSMGSNHTLPHSLFQLENTIPRCAASTGLRPSKEDANTPLAPDRHGRNRDSWWNSALVAVLDPTPDNAKMDTIKDACCIGAPQIQKRLEMSQGCSGFLNWKGQGSQNDAFVSFQVQQVQQVEDAQPLAPLRLQTVIQPFHDSCWCNAADQNWCRSGQLSQSKKPRKVSNMKALLLSRIP